MATGDCKTCAWEANTGRKVDTSMGKVAWAAEVGVKESSIRRHLRHPPRVETATSAVLPSSKDEKSKGEISLTLTADRIIPLSEWLSMLEEDGHEPSEFNTSHGHSIYGQQPRGEELVTLYANRFTATKKTRREAAEDGDGPLWPIVQPAARVTIAAPLTATVPILHDARFKVAIKCADTQIGFRILPDGSLDAFHDLQAMALFIEVCRAYQPDKITILGDFLDLASQGRFAQEASFARTTQISIDAGHVFLAQLRAACPNAEIILVEGNHDLRMQRFVETNALAAFGLKQANTPDSWPVMSLPFLLRLEELNIKYIDAYPAATDWDNDLTRNIHGTKANSKGSTMSQYVHELGHINTWAGHTHRAEVVYRTIIGARGNAIRSYAANPGCLCKTDGSVPSVHGAIGVDGVPVKIVEDWTQGFGVLYYNETESWPQVYRILDGEVVIGDRLVVAA